jgi:hypothetical protein
MHPYRLALTDIAHDVYNGYRPNPLNLLIAFMLRLLFTLCGCGCVLATGTTPSDAATGAACAITGGSKCRSMPAFDEASRVNAYNPYLRLEQARGE